MGDKFELPDGSYSASDIQDYIKYIIKKHETTIPPIHFFINRINNILVFKVKYEYKLELQMPKLIDKTKKRRKRTKS